MTTPAKAAGKAAAPFRLDIRAPVRRHGDRDQFIVLSLWLAGFSASSIATTLGLRRNQTLGICNRSPFAKRSAMSDSERQAELDLLREVRTEEGPPIDGGVLDRFTWKIQPISDGRKRRPAPDRRHHEHE
jgi:hypothetical protein